MTEVEPPQTYTFPQKYSKHPVITMHYKESDKKFFVKQPAREDSNNNGSENKDPSWVYQEIEPDNNVKTHHLKQAHSIKVE